MLTVEERGRQTSDHKRPTRRRLLWRGTLAVGMLTAALLSAGCTDKRLSLAQLEEMERQAAQREPVVVQPQQLPLTELRPYTVAVGDVLNVKVFGLTPQDPWTPTIMDLRVHEDGTIQPPQIDPIKVAGLTLSQVDQTVIKAHEPLAKKLSVYVSVTQSESTTVFVQGAATTPGLVKLTGNQRNVMYAVAAAGGFGALSSGVVRVQPLRSDAPEIAYNFHDANDVRRALLAPPLESGDMVMVDSADGQVVFVSGLVNAPGPIPVPPQKTLSLLQTIAASGGLVDFVDPLEATLWRTLPSGERVQVKIDLDKICTGEQPDIALRAGDILDVPHTPHTRFLAWVQQNIKIGPFGVTAVADPYADYRARVLSNRNSTGTGNLIKSSFISGLGSGISGVVVQQAAAAAAP
jgi:protein involved in polysaccharide export with SLBB domain